MKIASIPSLPGGTAIPTISRSGLDWLWLWSACAKVEKGAIFLSGVNGCSDRKGFSRSIAGLHGGPGPSQSEEVRGGVDHQPLNIATAQRWQGSEPHVRARTLGLVRQQAPPSSAGGCWKGTTILLKTLMAQGYMDLLPSELDAKIQEQEKALADAQKEVDAALEKMKAEYAVARRRKAGSKKGWSPKAWINLRQEFKVQEIRQNGLGLMKMVQVSLQMSWLPIFIPLPLLPGISKSEELRAAHLAARKKKGCSAALTKSHDCSSADPFERITLWIGRSEFQALKIAWGQAAIGSMRRGVLPSWYDYKRFEVHESS